MEIGNARAERGNQRCAAVGSLREKILFGKSLPALVNTNGPNNFVGSLEIVVFSAI